MLKATKCMTNAAYKGHHQSLEGTTQAYMRNIYTHIYKSAIQVVVTHADEDNARWAINIDEQDQNYKLVLNYVILKDKA